MPISAIAVTDGRKNHAHPGTSGHSEVLRSENPGPDANDKLLITPGPMLAILRWGGGLSGHAAGRWR